MTDESQPGRWRQYRWHVTILAVGVALAAISGASLGYFLRLDLPDIRALEDYSPPVMSRVLASDGTLVDTFAEQRRVLIEYHEIPRSFREALIATEDASFYEHTGIDLPGIARAAWSDLKHRSLAQGASTLTMQLARALFLHREKTIQRKLQEMVLALEIERSYTKEEILRFYCNQVYMGHGRYGLGAAARHYFGKHPRDLTIAESAMLAGLIQRPEDISPYRDLERSMRRRDHVIDRMVTEGYLTPEQAAAAREAEVVLASDRTREDLAPYFVEEVRRWLKARYGDVGVYQQGLEVRTTLDPGLQRIANEAVDLRIRDLDKRQGWRGAPGRVPDGEDLETWEAPAWGEGLRPGQVTDGVVVTVDDTSAAVRVGPLEGPLDAEDVAWTRARKPADILAAGDIVRVRLLEISEDGTVDLELEQEPLVEAALIAIDPGSGAVRAAVGGVDFERSEFNRATQARRQTGSAFKPLVYAAALADGRTLADTILDEPTVFLDPRTGQPYQPENYTNKYYGRVTLRRGIEKSANIATVKLLNAIGYDQIIDTARRLGISSELHPYPSLALGAFEVTLIELTAAYGTFANEGVRVEPHFVEEVRDRDGGLLLRFEPEVLDAVTPEIAYLMNRTLEGVITDGTGRAASGIKGTLAGKTGTTDDNTDAWFIGYSPELVVGVWVGFDVKKSLGRRETGALAALPIWKHFMERAVADDGEEGFPRPPGIEVVTIDRATGLRVSPAAGCKSRLAEVFVAGTGPTEYCSEAEHRLLRMPYPLQRYALDERGELLIPSSELDELLATDLTLVLSPGGRRIIASGQDGPLSIPIRRIPDGDVLSPPSRWEELALNENWVGLDGRPARLLVTRR